MNQQFVQLFISFYRWLLYLYPRRFREEFGAEMEIVLREQAAEAIENGRMSWLRVCGRELRHFPSSLLREHWHALRNRSGPDLMSIITKQVTVVSFILALFLLAAGGLVYDRFVSEALSWPWLIAVMIVCLLFIPAVRRMSHRIWMVAGLLFLVGLALPVSSLDRLLPGSAPFGMPTAMALTLFLILSLALIMVAVLLYSGLQLYQTWPLVSAAVEEGSTTRRLQRGRPLAAVFALGAFLLAKTLHSLYWLTVWDNTDDGLGYIWLFLPFLAVLFSAVLLSLALPEKLKPAGLLFLLLIPLLLVTVSAVAQRVDFRRLTEERAGRVSQAIERYYERNGRYPQDLQQLTPRYLLSLPGPVIIYGETWCYDRGDGYYRLGYVDRDHWSDPRLIGRIYKTAGELPDLQRMCEREFASIQQRYPEYPFSYRE